MDKQTQQEFIRIQNSLIGKIDCNDRFETADIKTVAGVDLAYWENDKNEEYAVCCIVVVDFITHNVLEKQQYSGKVTVPYQPGFLSFREMPLVLKAVKKLNIQPDIFMFDGNGYLHPRHMGLATFASFDLKTPTIGVAKSYYRADKDLYYDEPNGEKGSFSDIVQNGEIYGRVLRTQKDIKPVFVSVGNYISLDTATKITLSLVGKESRIPVPTRLADLETHCARKKYISEEKNEH